MASGWKFSVTLPSWTQTTLEGDEVVVFYRVEVKVLPPQGSGPPRIRNALRRYNHFLKLHSKLCVELGQKKMAGLDPPAKRSLFNVNRRPELIERRRRELQQWLWRLVNDPAIAKAAALNEFLELSDAARLVQRPVLGSTMEPPESVAGGSYAISEGSSPRGDAGSEASGFTSASQGSRFHLPGPTPAADFSMDSPARASWGGGGSAAGGRAPSRSMPSEDGEMRLGLKVGQRGDLRSAVQSLKRMLDAASSDLQDAVETIRAEKQAKAQLAAQVARLEARVNTDHTQREAELERLLAQERSASAGLREEVAAAATQQQQLQAELDELRPAEGEGDVSQRERDLEAEVARLEAERQDFAQQVEAAERRALEADAKAESATSEAQQLLGGAKAKAKADMKLLAKEVKSLRKQLAEAAERAEASEADAAAAASEAESLRASRAEAESLRQQLAAARQKEAEDATALDGSAQEVESLAERLHDAEQRLQQSATRADEAVASEQSLRAELDAARAAAAGAAASSARETELQLARAQTAAEEAEEAASRQRTELQQRAAELAAREAALRADLERMATEFSGRESALRAELTEARAAAERAAASAESLEREQHRRAELEAAQAATAAAADSSGQAAALRAELDEARAELERVRAQAAQSADMQRAESAAREEALRRELDLARSRAAEAESAGKEAAESATREAALRVELSNVAASLEAAAARVAEAERAAEAQRQLESEKQAAAAAKIQQAEARAADTEALLASLLEQQTREASASAGKTSQPEAVAAGQGVALSVPPTSGPDLSNTSQTVPVLGGYQLSAQHEAAELQSATTPTVPAQAAADPPVLDSSAFAVEPTGVTAAAERPPSSPQQLTPPDSPSTAAVEQSDPFAQSGPLDLFSGLSVSSPVQPPADPDSQGVAGQAADARQLSNRGLSWREEDGLAASPADLLDSQPAPAPEKQQQQQQQQTPPATPPSPGLLARFAPPQGGAAGAQQARGGVGSLMTRMGLGQQQAPAQPQPGQTQQPPAASGFPAMFGGRDRLENIARGLIRKTGGGRADQ